MPSLRPTVTMILTMLASHNLACGATAGAPTAATPEDPPPTAALARGDSLELLESWPAGTALDHDDLRDAADVWVEMIDGATANIDFLEFYGTSVPGSALEPVIAAVEAAGRRGVSVRFIFDKVFYQTMPEVPDRLARLDGVTVRIYDVASRTGGVQHAKMFVVDDRDAYLGSQNFDWRSLRHIQELGLRISDPALVDGLREVFALDWSLAAGASLDEARQALAVSGPRGAVTARFDGQDVQARLVLSPASLLPDPALWEWPRIRAGIDGAQQRVRLQFLAYHLRGEDGREWRELDDALRRAAQRGVRVELLVSNWEQREDHIGDLQQLAAVPNVEVRFVTIPEAATGFIPFARVIHSKYITIDGTWAWLGTSNGAGDYFLASRNVGLVVVGVPLARRLDGLFEELFGGALATAVLPDRVYAAPRIAQ